MPPANQITQRNLPLVDKHILITTDELVHELQSQIESQTMVVEFLQKQYKHMRARFMDMLIESEEMREMLKLFYAVSNELKAQKSPSREQWKIIISLDKIVKLIDSGSAKNLPAKITQQYELEVYTDDDVALDNPGHADITIIKNTQDIPRSNSSFFEEHPNMGALLKFPLFASFPKYIMQQISLSSYEMRRRKGQFLVRKGDEGAEIYFLTEGTATVILDNHGSTDLQPVTFFGELGVLFKFRRTATVVAKTNCIVVVVTKQKLNEIVANDQEIKKLVEDFTARKQEWWEKQRYDQGQTNFGAEFVNGIAREEIKKLAIFSAAPDSFCDSLSMRMKCIVYKTGENVCVEGEESDAMYFILKGSVQVVGLNGAINAELAAGSLFGEVGVLLKMKRTATIRAKEECNIFKLMKQDLDTVVKDFPVMANMLKTAADERLAMLNSRQTTAEKHGKNEHVPDQFDLEIGSQSLAKLSLFKGVEGAVLGELSMKMIRKSWNSGDFIIKCNERGDSMFFLAAGTAQIQSAFGEVFDTVSGPSAYFGEVAIMEQVPRTASVKCISQCSTYELKRDDFMSVIKKYPQILKQIKETADERMQNYLMRSILA
ncbi:camp-binding domain-like protein [Rhizoclosmatium globosum]|uniref:Camp-binding domain-like protein n=1 Tax=Rhizoclosmatium globosum TaxID=329046 RepID=A0A1Y2CUY5_9FUNG|nr:camp-binding domain-like protein [Rhizoclosmatium globosum]|eukprot:ORY50869.1 camp-binding domain-like protein [Rhizoclosmatium globosum]